MAAHLTAALIELEELRNQQQQLQQQLRQREDELVRVRRHALQLQQALNIATVTAKVDADINNQQLADDNAQIRALLKEAANRNYIPSSLLCRSLPKNLGIAESQLLERIRIRVQSQAGPVLPYVCCVLKTHFNLPGIFNASLMGYLRSLCSATTGLLSFQKIQELFLLLCHERQAKVLFTILTKGKSMLTSEDFTPIIHSIVNLHEPLLLACGSPQKLKRYVEFVQVSICQALSKRRQYRLTYCEFADGNLVDTLLLMGEATTDVRTSAIFSHAQFGKIEKEFTAVATPSNTADNEAVISAAQLSEWCNPTALSQILKGAVYELHPSTTANAAATRGFTFADWVWLRLSMNDQGEGLSAIDWFRCLDLDLNSRLCKFDLEAAVRSKCGVLLADDEARLEAYCRDSNMSEQKTARQVGMLRARYSVQRAAVLADVIMAMPEVAAPGGARRAALNRADCGMPLLFDMLVMMEKSKRWGGFLNFTGSGRVQVQEDADEELS